MTDIVNELRDIAEKIENIGTSSCSGGLFVVEESANDTTYILNKTWQEIRDAMMDSKQVIIHSYINDTYVESLSCHTVFRFYHAGDTYMISALVHGDDNIRSYTSNVADGYPEYNGGIS